MSRVSTSTLTDECYRALCGRGEGRAVVDSSSSSRVGRGGHKEGGRVQKLQEQQATGGQYGIPNTASRIALGSLVPDCSYSVSTRALLLLWVMLVVVACRGVQTVEEFYRLQHEQQTYDFVCEMENKSDQPQHTLSANTCNQSLISAHTVPSLTLLPHH